MRTPAGDRESDPAPERRAPAPAQPDIATARLQSAAGNRAVAALMAQRLATGQNATGQSATGQSATGQRAGSARDPRFSALRSDVRGRQKKAAAHAPAASKANAAQAAAKAPADDKLAQGKAANAEQMNAAQPGTFDKAAFVAAVEKAIADQAPKNLDEADKFSESGRADAVKGQVQGQVTQGKTASAKAITTTTNAPPDTAAAKEKPVTPLAAEQTPALGGSIDAGNAVPPQAPAPDLASGPAEVNKEMAAADVTDAQLAKSNEPDFTAALSAKKQSEQHAATAPGQLRASESKTLTTTKAEAAQHGAAAISALAGTRKQADGQVHQGQQGAQSSDEAKRAQVTAALQKVFDATKTDVDAILDGLDKKVDDTFTAGEKRVRDAFTADHKRRMDEYKDKRYSGFTGKMRWVKDKFAGLPAEANQIFVTARQGYVTGMRGVISTVADLIGGELNRAKQRIATGRDQMRAEVSKLPKDLQALGKKAAGEFGGRFDELTSSVDAKGDQLVETLATLYDDALKQVDAEIDAEKEKNKGLVAKAKEAVGGVLKTLWQLKDLLLGVLAKAASAVMAILKDPIGFLGHLISAVGAGLRGFIDNLGEHLKKGLLSWLLGAMASAGLQLPAKFDLRGILTMIGSLLGLTKDAILGRVVARGVPPEAVSAVEAGVPVLGKIQSEGISGITEEVQEQLGDLKGNLFSRISKFLMPTVLVAGITWIISLLNPASAFVKAAKAIIDIVTFIIDRGAQIVEFVNSVLDAIIAIAGGGGGGVPALIEKALAASIPVLIGALAAILGVSGIADKVKGFFTSLSKPVMKAVDWVVDKIVKFGKKIWAKLRPKKKSDPSRPPAGPSSPASLAKAKSELPGRYRDFLAGGPSRAKVLGKSEQWRKSYGLSDLAFRENGDRAVVVARTTEEEIITAVSAANRGNELNKMIREVADDLIKDPDVVRQVQQILDERAAGKGKTEDEPRVTQSSAAEAKAILDETRPGGRKTEHMVIGGTAISESQTFSKAPGHIQTTIPTLLSGTGHAYTKIQENIGELKKLGITDAEIMQGLNSFISGASQLPASIGNTPKARPFFAAVARLVYQVESGRNPATLITSGMATDVVIAGGSTAEQAVSGDYNTMAPANAGNQARSAGLRAGAPVPTKRLSSLSGEHADVQAFLRKEEQLMIDYITRQIETQKLVFADNAQLNTFVTKELREYLKHEIGDRMKKVHQ